MFDVLVALVLGLVEGLTEFIPVSSTGHLILVGHLLDFEGERAVAFEIFIQLGAILAVVVLYRQRFLDLLRRQSFPGFGGPRALLFLGLTTLPLLAIGYLARNLIESRLFTPLAVTIGLGGGGLAILLVERRSFSVTIDSLDGLTGRQALLIGLCQTLALWPGVSRSAATIVGGLLLGLKRETATEYSFLAAVPALLVAAIFKLGEALPVLQAGDGWMFGLGFLIAFLSAWLAIRFLLRFIAHHTLAAFGWYRIGLALIVFWLVS